MKNLIILTCFFLPLFGCAHPEYFNQQFSELTKTDKEITQYFQQQTPNIFIIRKIDNSIWCYEIFNGQVSSKTLILPAPSAKGGALE